MVYFDQIMHSSAENDQFAFHTFLLALDTDTTFHTGRAHYGPFISNGVREIITESSMKTFLAIPAHNVLKGHLQRIFK